MKHLETLISILFLVKKLHSTIGSPKTDSELCEIFQVASVQLESTPSAELNITFEHTNREICPRCRRFRTDGGCCERCIKILKEKGLVDFIC